MAMLNNQRVYAVYKGRTSREHLSEISPGCWSSCTMQGSRGGSWASQAWNSFHKARSGTSSVQTWTWRPTLVGGPGDVEADPANSEFPIDSPWKYRGFTCIYMYLHVFYMYLCICILHVFTCICMHLQLKIVMFQIANCWFTRGLNLA